MEPDDDSVVNNNAATADLYFTKTEKELLKLFDTVQRHSKTATKAAPPFLSCKSDNNAVTTYDKGG